jgi:hypothetical protein
MITRTITLIILAIFLVSCASTGSRMYRISPGMTKSEVIKVLGKPRSVGGGSKVEALHYMDDRGFWQYDYYFVRFVNGKVESYGPESKDQPVTDSNLPVNMPQ